ncbi:helix-turn-helix domain-containing protein [Reinekea sp. G2M2-21]|uniref:helix-turn-helix domain-containing protein n=1 Tax=Reinekea sp. G2M2-21 TaxID=2788942 RepID=UPI0018A8D97E|nr:helix-turn-helix domain-containing protein [Reinekea sp. G2M2-21]
MSSEYMNVAQAAAYLGVSEITVKRFIREKLIPSEIQNGQKMLSVSAVENYKKINEQFSKR